jgi:hypothetical protein
MKRFLPPITCVFVGMAAMLISSCAHDGFSGPPDPVPSAGYGYRSPPVESQNLPPPGATQYGPDGRPPGVSQYGPSPGGSQYGPPPAYAYGQPPGVSQYSPSPGGSQYRPPPAYAYGQPPGVSQYGPPPSAQGPLVVAPQYGQPSGPPQYGPPPSYQYGAPRS